MILLNGGKAYKNGSLHDVAVFVSDSSSHMLPISEIRSDMLSDVSEKIDIHGSVIFPGFADVHIHLREPGFSYKETISSGTGAAAHGGYTDVCSMPNLNPVPDSAEHLNVQLELIRKNAAVRVHPYGAITVSEMGEELSDMAGMAENVCAFSDDGRGVQNDDIMRAAMTEAKRLGKIIAAHCEVNSLLGGGYIHDGEYARTHNHRGISSESEWRQIERDLRLAAEIGVGYHVCHISTKESVELIREAKKNGTDVTCETAPHYLTLTENDLIEDGRFKMNPPLRSESDRAALIEGVLDGTVDMIATDHAPHSDDEKSRGLAKSPMGVVGLECAFPVLYTRLVKTGIVPLERIIEMMTTAPRKRFGLPVRDDDFTIFDLDTEYTIDPAEFVSMGHATPFAGEKVYGKCKMTVCGGKTVWLTK